MTNQYTPTQEELLRMYETMVLSRAFEGFMTRAYLEGKRPVFDLTAGPLPGEMHISSGQEPCAVGVCAHLRSTDYVVASHRAHHVAIAKGIDLNKMAAEIFGKKSGYSGGRGGHMHLFDPAIRFLTTGIVGQAIGAAVGHALAAQMMATDDVAVAFVGEGAANQGIFHEAMNLAGLWKLPFICVIEDNRWGISVTKTRSTAIARNSDRAASYAAAGEYIEDNDVWEIYAAAGRAVARARAGEGPTILEIETLRLAGHFVGDTEVYVPAEERAARRDPIDVMARRLVESRNISADDLQTVHKRTADTVQAAESFARTSPYPAAHEAMDHVFA